MQCVSRCHSARRGKSLALVEADEAVRRTGDAVQAAPVGFLGGELPALTLGSFHALAEADRPSLADYN